MARRSPADEERRNCLRSIALLSGCAAAFPPVAAVSQTIAGDEPIAQPAVQDAEHYIERARRLAALSQETGEGTAYGAVVVKDGRVVGEGRNRTIATNDPTAHSEIDAIRDACRRLGVPTLSGCEIYCSAKPCPMCQSACYWAGLEKAHYASGGSEIVSYSPSYSPC